MFKAIAFTILLGASLAGCSNDQEPGVARQDASVPQPAPAAPAASAVVPVAGVKFAVTPNEFRKCDAANGRTVAHVSWDVTAAGTQFVNVLVGSGEGAPKLFITGKATGEHDTGNWVVDGTQLILQDAANKHTLAMVTVKAKDC
jgi:hypothetical protein